MPATKTRGQKHDTESGRAAQEGSGKPAARPAVRELTLAIPREQSEEFTAAGVGSQLRTFFARITPDASPGWNNLTVNGLPAGTRAVSAWMTEFVLPNNPHAGGAFFTTAGVQLFNNGTQCRVRFHLEWNRNLPAAVQFIYGPG